ncbi:MAG: hypothetical protein Kow0063_34490 [Anaerolineae bacterium]
MTFQKGACKGPVDNAQEDQPVAGQVRAGEGGGKGWRAADYERQVDIPQGCQGQVGYEKAASCIVKPASEEDVEAQNQMGQSELYRDQYWNGQWSRAK